MAFLTDASGSQPLQQGTQRLIHLRGLFEQALLLTDHVVEQAPFEAASPCLERLDLLLQPRSFSQQVLKSGREGPDHVGVGTLPGLHHHCDQAKQEGKGRHQSVERVERLAEVGQRCRP